LDFAHSPSKVKATVQAVREAYPEKQLVACLELHTFSSLNAEFLDQYNGTMDCANIPLVYFNPETIAHKKLSPISPKDVKDNFGFDKVEVLTESKLVLEKLKSLDWKDKNLLIMTSGNFSGVNLQALADEIIQGSN